MSVLASIVTVATPHARRTRGAAGSSESRPRHRRRWDDELHAQSPRPARHRPAAPHQGRRRLGRRGQRPAPAAARRTSPSPSRCSCASTRWWCAACATGPPQDYEQEYLRLNVALDDATATLADVLARPRPRRRARARPRATARQRPPARSRTRPPPRAPASAGSARPRCSSRPSSARPCAWPPCSPTSSCRPASRHARAAAATAAPAWTPAPPAAAATCTWRAGMPRDELFDAAACRHQMTLFTAVEAQICGICIAACPYRARTDRPPGTRPPSSRVAPDGLVLGTATLLVTENGFQFQLTGATVALDADADRPQRSPSAACASRASAARCSTRSPRRRPA